MANVPEKKIVVTKKHLAKKAREEQQTRIIIIVTIAIFAIIMGLVIFGIVDSTIKNNKPVATIGDVTIKGKDLKARISYTRYNVLRQVIQYYNYGYEFGNSMMFADYFAQPVNQLDKANAAYLGETVLNEMINAALVNKAAEELGISVSDEEVNAYMQEMLGFFPDGTPTTAPTATIMLTQTLSAEQYAIVSPTPTATETPEPTATMTLEITEETEVDAETEEEVSEVEEVVDESSAEAEDAEPTAMPTATLTPTPYTTKAYAKNLDGYLKSIDATRYNTDDLRVIFHDVLLRDKLVDYLAEELGVFPVREQVWARHILVETEETAKEIHQRLLDGEDFAALAAEFSTDGTASNGGDLGWFDKGTMVLPFEEAAWALELGEISAPVQSDFGWHIIQSLGKQDTPYTESEYSQKKAAAFTNWLADYREEKGDVTIFDVWVDYVPVKPEVPAQIVSELYMYQLQQQMDTNAPTGLEGLDTGN